MISNYATLPDLLIPNGQNVSQVFNSPNTYGDAIALILYGSGTYGAETFTLEANEDSQATNASAGWMTLQGGSPAADLVPPLALKAKVFQEAVFAGSLRLKASGNVAADRLWRCNKVWTS